MNLMPLITFVVGLVVGAVLGYLFKRNSPSQSQKVENVFNSVKDKISKK